MNKVRQYANQHLSSIKRRSGESYADHGVEVSNVLTEIPHDKELLEVAILHDLLVHPSGARLLRGAPVNSSQKKLIKGMYALRRLHIDEKTKDLDLAIKTFTKDGRLVMLRMAHRLNDIRNISRFTPELQKRICREALHIYSSVAARLGLNKWRHEMENICFQVLHPKTSKKIKELFLAHEKSDKACLSHSKKFIEKKFKKHQLSTKIHERIKGHYSTYRKMVMKNRDFEQLTDRLALRIIVNDNLECYQVLGIIHQCMHPIPGKLKDYIGSPKENGYQSIHTVVYPLPGVTEEPLEIQIRTEAMQKESEFGIAAHSDYKIANYVLTQRKSRINLFQNLEQFRAEMTSPAQFEKALRSYHRSDHLMLFDHKNNLYHIKKPATVLDFCCQGIGEKTLNIKEIKVNGKKAELGKKLSDGDVIEVRFKRELTFKKSWNFLARQKSSKKLLKEWLLELEKNP